jgi:two-component system nitrate/nitrite response regulator NarL
MTPTQGRVRIVIADDHPLYRASVVRAISHHPSIEVVAEASDGRTALDEIRRLEPEVALVDMNMPVLDGAAVINAVARDNLPTRVMLLSGMLSDQQIYEALEQGAAAILTKAVEAPDVLDAVQAVARGEVVLAPELQAVVASQIRVRAREQRPLLTQREQEILACMAQGMPGPEIARKLNVSPSTVKSHTEKLYEKLSVTDRGAAVAEGMRQGLIE